MDTTVIEMIDWNSFWNLQVLFMTMGILGGGILLFIEQSFTMIWAHAQGADFNAQMEIEEAMEAVNNLHMPRFQGWDKIEAGTPSWHFEFEVEEEELNVQDMGDPLESPEPMGAMLQDADLVFVGMEMVTSIPEATQRLLAEESQELEEEELDDEVWERLLPHLERRQGIGRYMRAA